MRSISARQGFLRSLIAVMPVLATLCTAPAGEAAPVSFIVVVLLLSSTWAVFPESAAGVVVLTLVLVWWGLGLREGLDPWVLVAAAAFLVAHVAAVLAAYGPIEMDLDAAVVVLWVRRAALVFLASPTTFALAIWVRGAPEPAGVWIAALAATFTLMLLASLTLSRQVE